MAKFVVNGKSYASLDEMPPDVRQAYEQMIGMFADKNRNGIPDILEGGMGAGSAQVEILPMQINSTRFIVDGKVYSSVEELPPEARQKYEQAMAKAGQAMRDANRNGVPDILEGALSAGPALSMPPAESTPAIATSRPLLNSIPSSAGDDAPNYGVWLLLAGIVIAILLVAVIALGLFVFLPRLR